MHSCPLKSLNILPKAHSVHSLLPHQIKTEGFFPSRVAESLQTFKQAELFGARARVPVCDGSVHSAVKHLFEVVLRQSRTLHIVMGSDPVSQPSDPAVGHRLGAPLV